MSEEEYVNGLPGLSAFITMPTDLVFDDDPLEPLLYGGASEGPTPANVLELWKRGNREGGLIDAVAAVLVTQTELVKSIGGLKEIENHLWEELEIAQFEERCGRTADLLVALASMLRADGRFPDAIRLHRRAAEMLKETNGPNHEKTFQAYLGLVDLFMASGQAEEAGAVRCGIEIGRLFKKGDNASLLKLRNLAYDRFEKGDFKTAEAIYKRLLVEKFEVPGTLSHLARVLLAMPDRDNREEARKKLEEAWNKRQFAPDYVPPRILFWLTVLNFLEGKDSTITIGQLKFLLQAEKPSSFLFYTSLPVLERWKKDFSSTDYNFLKALSETLSSSKMLEAAETFPEWRNQPPVLFDSQ